MFITCCVVSIFMSELFSDLSIVLGSDTWCFRFHFYEEILWFKFVFPLLSKCGLVEGFKIPRWKHFFCILTTLLILLHCAVISVDCTLSPSWNFLPACCPVRLFSSCCSAPSIRRAALLWGVAVWQEACCVHLDHEWTLPVVAGCESIPATLPPRPLDGHTEGQGSVLGASFCGGARCLSALWESSASGFFPDLGRRISGALGVSLVCFLRPALASPLHFSFWSWFRVWSWF